MRPDALRLDLEPADLEAAIAFCEKLQGIRCERRLAVAGTGVEGAVVGEFVLVAGGRRIRRRIARSRSRLSIAE